MSWISPSSNSTTVLAVSILGDCGGGGDSGGGADGGDGDSGGSEGGGGGVKRNWVDGVSAGLRNGQLLREQRDALDRVQRRRSGEGGVGDGAADRAAGQDMQGALESALLRMRLLTAPDDDGDGSGTDDDF
mmetsp:Transcript_761/g.1552  ORF Transcript_761/g.1552 Transcript_761/m.1552 type:complete len:131 (+) Transcript_761:334-726(+)